MITEEEFEKVMPPLQIRMTPLLSNIYLNYSRIMWNTPRQETNTP